MKRIQYYLLLFLLGFVLFPMSAHAKEITLYLFHGDGCPHCASEITFLKDIEKKYDSLKVVKYEVWYNENNSQLLEKVQDAFDVKRVGVPTTVIGDTVITGFGDSTGSKIQRAIDFYLENDYVDEVKKIQDGTFVKEEFVKDDSFDKEEEKSDQNMTIKVPAVGNVNLKKVSLISAAVIIGFVDGFNPCAMWVLLFLIGLLIGMKDRKRMWTLGLAFLVTSALIYMLIMLSWISIVVKITAIVWIRNIIAVFAVGGGIWNLRSYLKTPDSGCEVVDDKRRKSIFKRIHKFTNEKSFLLAILGVIGLAASVNLVELACSAGLPIVFTELLVLNKVSNVMKFFYTLLYIFFFLIDDFIVFFIAMFTMKLTGISSKYNKYSHLVGGIIMLIVGVLLLFKPEWLMFQFK